MKKESSKVFFSILYPTLFVALLWLVKLVEITEKTSFASYGLYPRTFDGLLGIITTPLLHSDIAHLTANSIPLLILGPTIFYFYRSISFKIFFWVYIITGLWVWVLARNSYHIGASGIVYGFETFLFFSGVFRKDPRLLAISLFVVFLYGGTLWGVLPLKKGISWESHLLGALGGLLVAYNFREEGPKKKVYDFGDDDENELINVSGIDKTNVPNETISNPDPISISYNFVPKNREEEDQ